MKKVLLALAVLAALTVGTRAEACHTHGYVRASTLNDLFSSLPGGANSGLSFSAGGLSGNQLSNVNLDTINWNGGNGDNHQFSWSVHSQDNSISFGQTDVGLGSPQQQLDQIIGDVELALDAQYDKDYAD